MAAYPSLSVRGVTGLPTRRSGSAHWLRCANGGHSSRPRAQKNRSDSGERLIPLSMAIRPLNTERKTASETHSGAFLVDESEIRFRAYELWPGARVPYWVLTKEDWFRVRRRIEDADQPSGLVSELRNRNPGTTTFSFGAPLILAPRPADCATGFLEATAGIVESAAKENKPGRRPLASVRIRPTKQLAGDRTPSPWSVKRHRPPSAKQSRPFGVSIGVGNAMRKSAKHSGLDCSVLFRRASLQQPRAFRDLSRDLPRAT